MGATELQRYGRQMLVKDFGVKAQLKLRAASVLLVGVGGLGSPVAMYLAAMGVGKLTIVDGDHVDRSNLHRQVLHDEQGAREREKKVQSAKRRLLGLNPLLKCMVYPTRFTTANALKLVEENDIVVDASDNVSTRYLVNDACSRLRKPLVSGSALGMEGQVTVFTYQGDEHSTGCYRCLYPTPPKVAMSCAENGVVGVVPGVIGCLQAMETVKVITGVGEPLVGKEGREYVLLDTRAATQFEMVHFPEAVNIPTAQVMKQEPNQVIERLRGAESKISPSVKQTFVICRRGVDSVKVTKWLVDHGIPNVFNINGGYTEYAKEDPTFPMY
eukprot:jgi/Phyca11/8658/fgenesh1_pm.PHYCAscaffold_30_\